MDKNKLSKVSYWVGYIFATVLALCAIAIIIALTVKFLFWLF